MKDKINNGLDDGMFIASPDHDIETIRKEKLYEEVVIVEAMDKDEIKFKLHLDYDGCMLGLDNLFSLSEIGSFRIVASGLATKVEKAGDSWIVTGQRWDGVDWSPINTGDEFRVHRLGSVNTVKPLIKK